MKRLLESLRYFHNKRLRKLLNLFYKNEYVDLQKTNNLHYYPFKFFDISNWSNKY